MAFIYFDVKLKLAFFSYWHDSGMLWLSCKMWGHCQFKEFLRLNAPQAKGILVPAYSSNIPNVWQMPWFSRDINLIVH